jgi:FKBP-type peptidyl-prolyl cis-trans isomerase
MKINKLIAISFLLFTMILSSCTKSEEEQKQEDIKDIKEYLSDNNIEAIETESGLFYVIEKEGNDVYPTSSSTVDVYYEGYYLDEEVFDGNMGNAEPITFPLQGVIKGWTEGLQYFSEGAEGKLFIPSYLGYGPNDYYSIPGNSILIFDIKLVNVH